MNVLAAPKPQHGDARSSRHGLVNVVACQRGRPQVKLCHAHHTVTHTIYIMCYTVLALTREGSALVPEQALGNPAAATIAACSVTGPALTMYCWTRASMQRGCFATTLDAALMHVWVSTRNGTCEHRARERVRSSRWDALGQNRLNLSLGQVLTIVQTKLNQALAPETTIHHTNLSTQRAKEKRTRAHTPERVGGHLLLSRYVDDLILRAPCSESTLLHIPKATHPPYLVTLSTL